MARIRTIKPTFFSSADIVELSPLARLLYIGLWCEADREGRLVWSVKALKYRYLPGDECDINALTNELIIQRLVQIYQVEGKEYAYIPTFYQHQVINSREANSQLPVPPQNSSMFIACEQVEHDNDHVAATRHGLAHEKQRGVDHIDQVTTTRHGLAHEKQRGVDHIDQVATTRHGLAHEKQRGVTVITKRKGKEGKGKERKGKEEKGRERKGKECEEREGEKIPAAENHPHIVASQMRPVGDVISPEINFVAQEDQSPTSPDQPPTPAQQVTQVFDHWRNIMAHPNAHLDDKRKALIRKALKSGYSVSQLCQAIEGCSLTPHNIGDNERGQRYDGLHVILGDADQIDRFINNCHCPPHPLSKADRQIRANVRNAEIWAAKKMSEEEE